mgnify:CR=1 FL=1|tara:strand:- start:744 stop:2465 length:1722 start_codon:yes stop_codon:yes gene_type:complete
MDKTISRKYIYDTFYVDSAFRRPRDTSYDYNVYFESNDSNSARKMKDVVSIDVINAHLPVRNNNILAGLNSFDIHILENQTSQRVVRNATELQQFFTSLFTEAHVSNAITVSQELREISVPSGNTERYVKLRLESSSSVLLCDSNQFPSFDSETHTDSSLFTLHISPLLTQTSSPILIDSNHNFVTPLTFSVMKQSSVPVTLQPGYYPSYLSMINQLWSSLQYIDPSVTPETNLQFSDFSVNSDTDVSSGGLGWSSRREPQAQWSLYFRTNITTYSHIALTKRYHKNDFDLLSQFGLQYETVGDNWNEQTTAHKLRHAFLMKSYVVTAEDSVLNNIQPSVTERIDEQIILTNASRIFELRFNAINLISRRYVNVLIEQIPNAGCKLTNDNISNIVCRIDLTTSHFLQYSDSTSPAVEGGNNAQEGTSNNAFTSFTSSELQQNTSFFEPITLKGLNIKLKDNLGIDYDNSINHTFEFRITRLGDAVVPFNIPTHGVSSLKHSKRTLTEMDDYVEYRKQPKMKRRRNHEVANIQIQHANPLYQWTDDNKWAIIGTITTFFGTLYLSSFFTKRHIE